MPLDSQGPESPRWVTECCSAGASVPHDLGAQKKVGGWEEQLGLDQGFDSLQHQGALCQVVLSLEQPWLLRQSNDSLTGLNIDNTRDQSFWISGRACMPSHCLDDSARTWKHLFNTGTGIAQPWTIALLCVVDVAALDAVEHAANLAGINFSCIPVARAESSLKYLA